MKRKKRLIRYKKERVVLSDVLPFEIPITFSNRHLYDFLTTNKVQLVGDKIMWGENNPTINEVIKLLFDFRGRPIITNEISFVKDRSKKLKTIPFNFKICHKENDFRTLTLIHPKSQLDMIDFYDTNKHLILHYCSISPFSIRRAEKVSKFVFYKDNTHKKYLSKTQEYDSVEEYDKEYENLRTFFVYKNYGNIHKFYESYKYHRCEKKYNNLFKFDISKCFDSIYSHSIAWALLNKEIVKDSLGSSNDTFGGKFDTVMQNLNYGETNGIVIGPEFSRIFAELILQKIDRNIEAILREKEDLKHKVDYEIFRYVDDFFVFYNNESTKEKVLKHFRLQLKEFKLYLNDAKTIHYEKPIITEITIAKQNITELINKYLAYKIDEEDEKINKEENELTEVSGKTGSIYINSNNIITKFKAILKETKVDYKDILNYALSLIERKVAKIIKNYTELERNEKSEKEFIKAILEILDFTFFLYSVSPRVNTTIKLCRILRNLTEFLSVKGNVNMDFKHLTFKKIYDNIYFTLQKNKSLEHSQVETLYLLIALGELGKEYWLDTDILRQYVCIEKDEITNKLSYNGSLNYFAIVVLLFYMKDKKRYFPLKDFLKKHIKVRFNEVSKENIGKCAELVFLLFDVITCPYLDMTFKKQILTLNGVLDSTLQDDIIAMREHWFTKWTNFDFGKELDAKHSEEVY